MQKPKSNVVEEERNDANRDPLTDAPGAHPVSVGVGAASGAATGAMIGAVGGPVGSVIGAAVGGVAGGLAGKMVGEGVNPTIEDEYWQSNHDTLPYAEKDHTYEQDYRPAYRYGWESYSRYPGRQFDDVESDLERDWDQAKGSSKLTWDKAKHATKEAWHRVERALPGDFDKDGR